MKKREESKSSSVHAWVTTHLGQKFHVHPSLVDDKDKLEHWGYGDPADLASLIGDFNRNANAHRAWRNAVVTPPEAIRSVSGKNVGDLISLLSAKVAAANITSVSEDPASESPQRPDVEAWLLGYLRKNTGKSVNTKTTFASIKFPPQGDPKAVWTLITFFKGDAAEMWKLDVELGEKDAESQITGKRVSSLVGYLWTRVQAAQGVRENAMA